MRGLNTLVDIYERAQGADDAVGGSVRTDNLRYGNVRARVSNPRQSRLLLEQGFEARHIHDIIIYPAQGHTGVQEEDIVVPQDGALAGARLRVKGVHLMSLRPNTPRSHIQLRCERLRYAHENTPEA